MGIRIGRHAGCCPAAQTFLEHKETYPLLAEL